MRESGEMYLETILVLGKRKNVVRAIDVAEERGFSKASVSRAFSHLKQDGCIIVDDAGRVALTEKGRQIAEKIYERHRILTETLVSLGVPEETAAADACKIEHDLSDESFDAIKEHTKKHLNGE